MEQKFKRNIDEIKNIVTMTEIFFEQEKLEPQYRNAIDLATEELFVNMVTCNINTNEDILIQMSLHEHGVEVSLTDYDVEPFDPLSANPVNINAPLEERTPGGLGLHLVNIMVDSINYQYCNRQSKITFVVNGN